MTRLRWALTLVAAAALVLLYIRPTVSAPLPGRDAVLATPGAESMENVDFAVGTTADGVETLPDLATLRRRHPDVEGLRVRGHGLPAWQWNAFPNGKVAHLPPPPPAGVRRLAWPRELHLGDDLVVTGVAAGVETLRLEGPGGMAESVEPDDDGAFTLRERPRDAGRFLYRLVPDDGTALELDVVVRPSAALRVLWLEDAPSFETRHFKRWHTANGGLLDVRTRLSRERFRVESHRPPDAPARTAQLEGLTPGVLDGYDLAVVDAAALAGLARAERDALEQTVRERGLGLLVRTVGERGLEALKESVLGFGTRSLDETLQVSLSWPGAPPLKALSLPGREIDADVALRGLAHDGAGRVLAAARPLGRGVVALSLVEESYRWVLDGDGEDHGRLWSRLLGEVARRREVDARWLLAPGPCFVDEPFDAVLEIIAEEPSARLRPQNGSDVALAFVRDTIEENRYRTRFWPREEGWQQLDADGAEAWLHCVRGDGWEAWELTRRREATARRAALSTAAEPSSATERREIPRGIFFGVFLVAVALLWADERWRLFG